MQNKYLTCHYDIEIFTVLGYMMIWNTIPYATWFAFTKPSTYDFCIGSGVYLGACFLAILGAYLVDYLKYRRKNDAKQ